MPKSAWKLGNLSVTDLVDLRNQVDKALHDRVSVEQGELRARMDELAALTTRRTGAPARVNGAVSRGRGRGRVHALKGRKVAPKYRGPNGETWTGRGLAPRWLSDLEKKGKKRDSFLINQG